MTMNLIRLAENDITDCKTCDGQRGWTDGEQWHECTDCDGTGGVYSVLATAILPILRALEVENKKPCEHPYYTFDRDMFPEGYSCKGEWPKQPKKYCRPCFSRHLIEQAEKGLKETEHDN